MSNEKPQLHQSMLEMDGKCGIQFLRRYGARFGIWEKEEISPPGVALGIGSAVHTSVEKNLTHRITASKFIDRDEAVSIARDQMLEFFNGEYILTEAEAVDATETMGRAIDLAIALAGLHYDEAAPQLVPVAVEEKFVVNLEGYPFDLAGTIDVREEYNGKDGAGHPRKFMTVRDTKTAGRTPRPDEVKSIQLALYAMAHEVLYDRLPDSVFLDVLVKNKKPKYVTVDAVPDDKWIAPLKHRIELFARKVTLAKKGYLEVFTPASGSGPMGWICTADYCGYARSCRYWSGR